MFNDVLTRNALVPLILRLTLGAIFIYHGAYKVFGERNDYGAAWATNSWAQQSRPPADVVSKLEALKADEDKERAQKREEEINQAKSKLDLAYAQSAPPLPDTLGP